MHPRYIGTLFLLLILVACGSTAQSQPTASSPNPPATASGRTITIAAVNSSPTKRIAAMQPLADYLATKLASQGVTGGQVKVAANTNAMVEMVNNNDVDVFFDTAYTALLVGEQTKAKPMMRWWKDGRSEYHSVFLTLADSPIKTIDQVKGKVVAFEQAFSTSGYFIPRTYLANKGFTLQEVSDPTAAVAADTIGYAFSGNADNTIQWLISKRTSVGVINNIEYNELKPETKKQLWVLVETQPIVRAVVMFNSNLDPVLQTAIIDILSTMHENPNGKNALATFDRTSKFEVLTADEQQQLQKLYDLAKQ